MKKIKNFLVRFFTIVIFTGFIIVIFACNKVYKVPLEKKATVDKIHLDSKPIGPLNITTKSQISFVPTSKVSIYELAYKEKKPEDPKEPPPDGPKEPPPDGPKEPPPDGPKEPPPDGPKEPPDGKPPCPDFDKDGGCLLKP